MNILDTWKIRLTARFLVLVTGVPVAMFAADTRPSVTDGPPVRMQPFKVAAEWMEIQPLLRNKVIESVRIVHVREPSPAAAAGVRQGMRIIEFQGINVVGLTEDEFVRRMDALPPADRFNLKVRGIAETTEFAIPFSPGANSAPAPRTMSDSPAIASPPAAHVGGPSRDATEAAKKMLGDIRRALEREAARARAEARTTGSARLDSSVMAEAARLAGAAAALDLGAVCQAAVEAEGNNSALPLLGILTSAIRQPRDYAPAHKAIVLKYLPKLPGLIAVVERMQWFDGADAAIVAGWKKAARDERDGMLTQASSQYAIIAARRGVTDALVALARIIRNPNADKRARGRLLEEETAAIKALVPSNEGTPAALAEFVIKNKAKLVFDAEKSVYTINPRS